MANAQGAALRKGKAGPGWLPVNLGAPASLPALPGDLRWFWCSKAGLICGMFCLAVGAILCGCAVVPAERLLPGEEAHGTIKAVMARNDRIVHLSAHENSGQKPVLLVLHGATEDPTEMIDVVRECRQDYDVYLFSYNFHSRIQKVAADLSQEVKRLRLGNIRAESATVIVYSYSAVVFRKAVLSADDSSLFSGMSLIQLVPTAGGSRLARWMRIPVLGSLAGMASKPSYAVYPYGDFTKSLWDDPGNAKFYHAIRPERTWSILLENDEHSLAEARSSDARRRYRNGIGTNVVVIPKSAGVTHDYFPTHPAALEYIAKVLREASGVLAQKPIAPPNTAIHLTHASVESRSPDAGINGVE